MLPLVTLDGLGFRTPDGRTLFDNLTFALAARRIGLVGANGCGKTTLLRLILGELTPGAGALSVRGRVGHMGQNLAAPEGAVLADVLGVAEGLVRLARIERGDASPADLDLADWSLPTRTEDALGEVGLAGRDLRQPAATLSGGEATRAALAGLLIAAPDLLLLDEPTNNLDAEARAIVAGVLARWRGGALVASHDRALLRGMDAILELSPLGARLHGGGYDLYIERRRAETEAAARELDSASREVRRVEREIQSTRERQDRRDAAGARLKARGGQPRIVLNAMAERAEGTRAGQSHLAERRRTEAIEALEAAKSRVDISRRLDFALPATGLAAGKTVLVFEDVTFGWAAGRPLFEDLGFRLVGPERLAVVGPNGSGKSTLIGLITGAITPTRGHVIRGIEPLVLDQRAALLRDDETVIDAYRRLNPEADDNQAHAALARMLFRNVAALKPVWSLSGGERLRAALACVLMTPKPPRFVILDEPTNHLDLPSIEAVEAAVAAYDGALLVVSHDEDFLAAVGVTRRLTLG